MFNPKLALVEKPSEAALLMAAAMMQAEKEKQTSDTEPNGQGLGRKRNGK